MPLNYASFMAVTLSNEFIPLKVMIRLFTSIPCIITWSLTTKVYRKRVDDYTSFINFKIIHD